jgi:hypothetical protein
MNEKLKELYKFCLTIKGRGLALSPKELNFLKELLEKGWSIEEIQKRIEKCFKQVLPPEERLKSPITRCRSLFKKPRKF